LFLKWFLIKQVGGSGIANQAAGACQAYSEAIHEQASAELVLGGWAMARRISWGLHDRFQ
jgi:hypothetical protein